jgi:hypothetical protein
MAVSAVAASVVVRNASIEARFPGGLSSFSASCPNQTFCTDGSVSRVGFMTREDAETFIHRLVAAGVAPSLQEAHSQIALIEQGHGFAYPCDWLQLGLFDGRPCVWLANQDRGDLFLPKSDLDPATMSSYTIKEFKEMFELTGVKDNVEVYRHRATGEIRYVGRPFRSAPRKWWQIWKRPAAGDR